MAFDPINARNRSHLPVNSLSVRRNRIKIVSATDSDSVARKEDMDVKFGSLSLQQGNSATDSFSAASSSSDTERGSYRDGVGVPWKSWDGGGVSRRNGDGDDDGVSRRTWDGIIGSSRQSWDGADRDGVRVSGQRWDGVSVSGERWDDGDMDGGGVSRQNWDSDSVSRRSWDGGDISRRSWDNESVTSKASSGYAKSENGTSVYSIGESRRTRKPISVCSDDDIQSEQSWAASEMSSIVKNHQLKMDRNAQATNFRGVEHRRFKEFRYQRSLTPVERMVSVKERQFGQPLLPDINGYCCKHCIPETCRPFERYVQGVCCRNGMCRECSHTCCSEHNKYNYNYYNPPPCSHNIHHHGYDQPDKGRVGSSSEDVLKHCLPIKGGMNFVLCYTCFWVLQIPEDLRFLEKKKYNLECGHCGEILSYLINGNHMDVPWYTYLRRVPDNPKDVQRTQRTDSDADKLHRLMGYYSASDILYEIESSDKSNIKLRKVPPKT